MQILLNHGEVGQAVIDAINNRVMVLDTEVVHVTLTEDGATVSILPEGVLPESGDDANEDGTQPTGERQPKKTRRTKAQIEADNKAEAERLAKEQEAAASGNDAVSSEKHVAEAKVVHNSDAGETTPEASDHGEEAAADPIVDTAVAVEPEVEEEQAAVEPEPVVETEAEAEAPAVKPAGVSLFQNLRRPNNG